MPSQGKCKYQKPGTVEKALMPCAGGCGRVTRPRNMLAYLAPGTLPRRTGGYCYECWPERPLTKRRPHVARNPIPVQAYTREEQKQVDEWRQTLAEWQEWRLNRPRRSWFCSPRQVVVLVPPHTPRVRMIQGTPTSRETDHEYQT
jgi:hypothetical protein